MKQTGYLFIANGRIIPIDEECSLEPVKTGSFERSCMYAANSLGMKLYMGINRVYAENLKAVDYDITFYNQHIYRNILGVKDIYIGYKNLSKFLKTHPEIQIIHCNTPIGGVLGRICGFKFNKTVIYTAHGFHFYKGAPLLNRTIFKGIEKFLANFTDGLITINNEDYEAAKKFTLHKNGKIFFVPGVGLDLSLYENVVVNKNEKLNELNINSEVRLGIVVGDLNDNKNVETIIRSLPFVSDNFHILICGFGPNEVSLKKLASIINVSNRVHFLGFRTDVKELYAISDVFLFASKREGLPRSTMEAMCMGLPCVVSNIRGNIDLIDDNLGGYLISPKDYKAYSLAINNILNDPHSAKSMGNYNKEKVKKFSLEEVNKQMIEVYKNFI